MDTVIRGVLSVSTFFDGIKEKVRGHNKTIVFPESSDERVLTAVSRFASDEVIRRF